MGDHLEQTIAHLLNKLRDQEFSVRRTKTLINDLCVEAKLPPKFGDAEIDAASGPSLSIQADQFYGQPLATCMRQILEMRRALNQGPAAVQDFYTALAQGGYAFDTKNEDNAKRGLRVSLTKNTSIFHKLPNNKFGLVEWYPNAKASKRKDTGQASIEETQSDDASDDVADPIGDENSDGGES